MHTHDRAVVLGPGGYLGTAWMAGLAQGLRGHGLDLGEADLFVGTSAGAMVAAMLATGQDFERIADPAGGSAQRPADGPADAAAERPRPPAPGVAGAVFAVLGEPGVAPEEARRRVGRIALEHADDQAQRALVAQRGELIGADAWPERPLLISAVQAENGEPVVWDRTSGVPLVHAVAASSAFPGTAPPVAIDGRHYIDGALRAGLNADLAEGARTLVVVAPLAHQRSPHEELAGQPAVLAARDVVVISPEAALPLGPGAQDPAAWAAAYQAGLGDAAAAAEQLRGVWAR
ncbi:patatin-like phospholipase family protein [Kitasatospora sp. LaBMicrA B282]|uniref:patatin-like phospholipase family protein n=1 Tax=Kitasatospora sp. LaBMicrA B282 TaxID=3420949 RepID=UPI003D10E38F